MWATSRTGASIQRGCGPALDRRGRGSRARPVLRSRYAPGSGSGPYACSAAPAQSAPRASIERRHSSSTWRGNVLTCLPPSHSILPHDDPPYLHTTAAPTSTGNDHCSNYKHAKHDPTKRAKHNSTSFHTNSVRSAAGCTAATSACGSTQR